MSGNQQKDIWDKIASLSGIFLTTLVAFLGFYFTHKYEMANQNRNKALDDQNKIAATNQVELQKLEAVERLLPHLSGKDADATRQKLTLLALRELGNRDLAIQFAEILDTDGAKEALQFTASNAESAGERSAAKQALYRPELRRIIKKITSPEGLGDDFALLEINSQYYMQAVGVQEGFHLEYREGSGERHYGCEVSKSVLLKAFRSYAADDDSWRTICNWEKMNL